MHQGNEQTKCEITEGSNLVQSTKTKSRTKKRVKQVSNWKIVLMKNIDFTPDKNCILCNRCRFLNPSKIDLTENINRLQILTCFLKVVQHPFILSSHSSMLPSQIEYFLNFSSCHNYNTIHFHVWKPNRENPQRSQHSSSLPLHLPTLTAPENIAISLIPTLK